MWKTSRMIRLKYGASLISLLVTLSIFSLLLLSISQWQSSQLRRVQDIYQRVQAVQLAENQKQRLFVGLPCESQIKQNQLQFQISCQNDRVTVRYPRGELKL